MPIVWAAISSHGYGHAAQIIPVLNELGTLVPDLSVILRTAVPSEFFQDRLDIPWTIQSVEQDIGCIQQGPLKIDIPATWRAHFEFHADWEQRLEKETSAIRSARPNLAIINTSYLACRAAFQAGVPTVGLANLTWSEVLRPYLSSDAPDQLAILSTIEESYAQASFALRIAPGLPLAPFKAVIDIAPIAQPSLSQRVAVRAHLSMPNSDRLVLIGFGGIPLDSLPWSHMNSMKGVRFVFDGDVPASFPQIVSLKTLPYSFKTMLASCDAVLTKPGYGTVVESVALALAVLYVRRYNFADEQPIVDFLETYGRGCELPVNDFLAGRWERALETAFASTPRRTSPSCTGAADAARHLMRVL